MHHISHLFASRKPFIVPFILSLLVYGGALFILSPHITHAAGNTYYVATTGSDSNSGTISSPFRTIAKGLSMMGAGDTLYLRGGIYNERILRDNGPIPVGTSWSDAPLIAGYPGERVVMTQGIGLYGSDEKYIKFDNFVFDTAYNSGDTIWISIGAGHMRFTNFELMHSNGSGGVQLPETGAGYNEFINCKVHDNGVRSRYDHGFYISSNNNLVENCDIYNNAAFGVHVYSGTPSNNIIRNNKIYNNGLLTQGSDTTAFGLLFHSGSNNEAYNNLIYNNTSGVAINGGSNNQIYNNTVYGNTSNGYAGIEVSSGSSGTIVKNNILWQNSYDSISDSGAGIIQSNNLTTDPKFMNASANDFHLQPTSPAVNAGATISQVTTDKDGVIRPVGCCYDIGAYEYGGSTPTPTPTHSSGPSACSLYTPSSSIPAGFGSPYDVLSSPSTLLISATCDVSSARIDLGKGDPLQYIYNTGSLFKTGGTNWTPISYTSTESLIAGSWYPKSATTTIPLTSTELANPSYVLGYVCAWQTSQWKCGCRDSQCTQSYWQIQSFKR